MQVNQLLDDSACKAILFVVDSPGGEVAGTQGLAQTIFEGRKRKKMVTVVDGGMMCSAALWIGTAAHEVYTTVETTCIGSIGVVARHVDVSVAESMAGVKTTLVTSGKFKAEPSPFAPLSTDGREVLQSEGGCDCPGVCCECRQPSWRPDGDHCGVGGRTNLVGDRSRAAEID